MGADGDSRAPPPAQRSSPRRSPFGGSLAPLAHSGRSARRSPGRPPGRALRTHAALALPGSARPRLPRAGRTRPLALAGAGGPDAARGSRGARAHREPAHAPRGARAGPGLPPGRSPRGPLAGRRPRPARSRGPVAGLLVQRPAAGRCARAAAAPPRGGGSRGLPARRERRRLAAPGRRRAAGAAPRRGKLLQGRPNHRPRPSALAVKSLYREHLDAVAQACAEALDVAAEAGERFEGVVFHAGTPRPYAFDDQFPPFRPVPHFARWVPLRGPGHALVWRRGAEPRLVRYAPRDFWEEPLAEPEHPYAEVLEVACADTPDAVRAAVGDASGLAYVGDDPAWAEALGLSAAAVGPRVLLAALDWQRATKTPYEVECVRRACALAARGHAAVRAGVARGLSERALHRSYLEALGALEHETPYPNIIAWDAMGAVLHYQSKRANPPSPGRTLLVDAGAQAFGYASDVTRTYAREDAHPVFCELLAGLEGLQRRLVAEVRPGRSFVDLHAASFRGVCELLCAYEVLTVSADEAYERGLAFPFYPHGLGHHLGLQVHDVGGQQVDPQGTRAEPPERFPWLRTTRPLAEGHVVTVEPGIYFIPLLLDPYREGEQAAAFNWSLIDVLAPLGGIRIEDDVLVARDGPEDLSRPHVP
ncbi:MAG: Xaa-Pro dipeptidase [Planctomycetota bacterium]|nr:MAG: Xaa-Pro dipeptidase [Planctomycetota bacterium]